MNLLAPRRKFSSPHLLGLMILLPLVAGLLAGCGLFRELVPVATPGPETILRISADQAAQAMQEDHFFYDYNPYTLLVQGSLAALTPQGTGTRLELKTSLPTKVLCDLQDHPAGLQIGDVLTISAPAAQAQRANGAVLFKPCEISK